MNWSACRERMRNERGSVSVEVAIGYVPLMVLAVVAVIACLRLTSATSDVNAAAAAAARQAANARTVADAQAGGEDAAAAILQARSIGCRPYSVTVTTDRMRPGGQVSVTVRCTVPMQDLYGLGLPGAVEITGTATQPVDRYRGNSLGFANSEASSGANPSTGGA